jgi:DNA-binding NarL/FixJ family response regulator
VTPEPAAEVPLRVLIADDHPVVRRGLGALVGTLPGMVVVGEASDGAAAVKEAQLLRPDVVIMDIAMPGVDGLEATRRIAGAAPEVAVLVLTMHDDEDTLLAALEAGARGYLLKGAEQAAIESAIRSVAVGQLVFGADLAGRLRARLAAPPVPSVLSELTAREREVLDLMAQGCSNALIASRLQLASKTVGNHASAIVTKLGVPGRADAVALARRNGLGPPAAGGGGR